MAARHHFDTKIRRLRYWLLAGLMLTSVACTVPYNITPVSKIVHPPVVGEVGIQLEAPTRSHEVIAEFRGSESANCPDERPYCTLRDQAREMGGDAVWIQSRSVYKHQDEWIMIQGRLTKIHHPQIETIAGVIIRYTD